MKKVVIDPGHGGKDSGAKGLTLLEKNVVLEISKRVVALLTSNSVEVIITRSDDVYLSLKDRVTITNKIKPDLFVSIHNNAHSDSSANGFEIFVYVSAIAESRKAHQIIHNRVSKVWTSKGRKDRGTKQANFHVLRETKCPAVLIELGFLSNKTDHDLLKKDEFIEENAQAIAVSISEYLGVLEEYKPEPDDLYRVIVNGKQIGAFAQKSNLIAQVNKALSNNAKSINLEKV